MESKPTLEDLIGIEYAKLGFFREVQEKIAELHASNLELARRQREIQAILNGITDVMAVVSMDLQVVSVNHVLREVFGEVEPEGKRCYQVFRQVSQPCVDCPVITAIETNHVCRRLCIFPVAGKNRHFEITASPLLNCDGDVCNVLVLKRDVTLEKEYQAKYYMAEKMATVGVLAAGVAHEINNPLTAISGFAEGLRRRLPKLKDHAAPDVLQDFTEYIGIILKECERCREIVQTLLTFGRHKSSEFTPVNLNTLVMDTFKLLRHHLKLFPEHVLTMELSESLPLVYGDASQLKQVILNLILNALDAVRAKGTVAIRTSALNDIWAGLAVEDTGCGIQNQHLDKLFEPFFTTKPVGKGIGVGLSTCYNIVQSHGGEIMVSSEEGQGSLFLVKLPRKGGPW
jgi:two-component system, NtrC family, sensor kinase